MRTSGFWKIDPFYCVPVQLQGALQWKDAFVDPHEVDPDPHIIVCSKYADFGFYFTWNSVSVKLLVKKRGASTNLYMMKKISLSYFPLNKTKNHLNPPSPFTKNSLNSPASDFPAYFDGMLQPFVLFLLLPPLLLLFLLLVLRSALCPGSDPPLPAVMMTVLLLHPPVISCCCCCWHAATNPGRYYRPIKELKIYNTASFLLFLPLFL